MTEENPSRREGMALLAAASAALLLPNTASALSEKREAEQQFEKNEIVDAVADFFGITASAAADVVERVFKDQGQPNAYIKGQEGSAAIGVGLRYGHGELTMKGGGDRKVFWRGPSVGWDAGANASKVFTLVYHLPQIDAVFRRFPGVEGTFYLVGGVGVNYQVADGITLAPMRAGVGLRAGANIGYLAYSKRGKILPF
jgi:hypothetical protein